MKVSFLNYLKSVSFLLVTSITLAGCGSKALVGTPIENTESLPVKVAELDEAEAKRWGHADLLTDTIPGMSVERAYEELLPNLKVQEKVIVAVLDSGIDLKHEDLDGVLWTNKDEVAGNDKDDDNNGFVDDVHGYNFLGESLHENLEYTRIVRLNLGDSQMQAKALSTLNKELEEAKANKARYDQLFSTLETSDEAVKKYLGKSTYTAEDLAGIPSDAGLQQNVGVLQQMLGYGAPIDVIKGQIQEGVKYFDGQVKYHLNKDFDGRTVVGDKPYDINSRGYGNGNPMNRSEDESHGSHVAGIIAAERGNGLGVDGVADHVQIMSIRAVPDGDEYDKDIALGIRYAVDNGARIINASFGKSFSPNKEWVYEAIKYAAEKDVLFVHAAGNDGLDLDDAANANYPNDQVFTGPEMADNVITIGSLNDTYGPEMVSAFSNYGLSNVDIFAPGGGIYSTMPGNEYEFQGGTSMAAPAVSGIAALILSRYPKLSASQVKKIIMQSGVPISIEVNVAGDESAKKPLKAISRTGKIANAYNALLLADQVSRGKISL
ncbi:S8 family peptidase [Robiginitalea aurantiaca]|uniref:S8 family peptidase n=1 Tax=Robiginitalea aurantiaca TaxID=3056915 RepID=A0ABT7WA98_9FLAO|nr:S8 family peptidase [Robiginitalea aurantiaca]MDM9629847.1 S8 family peptidase [Robiginitalea aurantiaca]